MLELFWIFFKIGLFTIGGGYAMISLIENEIVERGWITQDTFADYLAISESTPGPLAINAATLIGNMQYGVLGAIVATFAVVLPSFIIIITISMFLDRFLKNRIVGYAMFGVKPVVIGLIAAFVVSLVNQSVLNSKAAAGFDLAAAFIIIFIFSLTRLKKNISPIILLILSAILGILFYYVM